MPANMNTIYALDFDGVICDSAVETGVTGWKVAQRLWADMPAHAAPEAMIDAFRCVRPMIETGYEAILVMRLLSQGLSADVLIEDYHEEISALLEAEEWDASKLKQGFGETRDDWIARDMQDWLQMNPLFPGVAGKLKTLAERRWYVITTKQERFVKLILQASGISIPAEHIFGLDRQLGKQEVLQLIADEFPQWPIFFVEDRLPTLQAMEGNQSLRQVHRQLADWGYNTKEDREAAAASGIQLISLEQFVS